MKSRNKILVFFVWTLLTVSGLVGQPSFSPDSSKVVFTLAEKGSGMSRVLIYDRVTERMSSLLTLRNPTPNAEPPLPKPIWLAKGKQILVSWGDDRTFKAALMVPGEKTPRKTYTIDDHPGAISALTTGPVLLDQNVYLGGQSMARLNLATGDVTRTKPVASYEAFHVFLRDSEMYDFGSRGTVREVGLLNPESLDRSPYFQFDAVAGASPFLAVSRFGGRLALVVGDAEKQELRIYEQLRLARTVNFGKRYGGITLGNLLWARNGKTLYAAGFQHSEEDLDTVEVTVCEIPMKESPMRKTAVFKAPIDERNPFVYQITLAQDRRTMAVSSAVGLQDGAVAGEPTLHLVNLKLLNRAITRAIVPDSLRPGL